MEEGKRRYSVEHQPMGQYQSVAEKTNLVEELRVSRACRISPTRHEKMHGFVPLTLDQTTVTVKKQCAFIYFLLLTSTFGGIVLTTIHQVIIREFLYGATAGTHLIAG